MCSDCIISQDIEIVLMTNQMFQGALVISCIKVELAMPHQITPFCICSHVRLSNLLFVLVAGFLLNILFAPLTDLFFLSMTVEFLR